MKKVSKFLVVIFCLLTILSSSYAAETKAKPKVAAPASKPAPVKSTKPLPDLVVERVWLDRECQINFQLKNMGPGDVPNPEHLQGMVRVYFGKVHEDFYFRKAAPSGKGPVDGAGVLRTPGSSVQYDTGIKLDSAASVVVSVDENQKINESKNDNNRSATLTLTPTCRPSSERMGVQPTKTAPATNPKIQALVIDLDKANTIDEVGQAFKRASLSEGEMKEVRPMLEGPLGQRIHRLVMQTRVEKKAAFEAKKHQIITDVQAYNKGLQERQVQMLNQGNQQATAVLHRLRVTASAIRVPATGDYTPPAIHDKGSVPPASTIQSVSPARLMAGQSLTVSGLGFGSTRGRLAIVIGRNLFTCDVSSWSDTRITATLPLLVQESVREGEQRGFVWVKLAGGEIGPRTEVTFVPDQSKLVPEITELTPESIQPSNGQTIVISGRNFLSRQPGHAILRFVGGPRTGEPRVDMELFIGEWTDTYIFATYDLQFARFPDVPAMPESAILIVRNHLGLETTRIIHFEYPLHREVAFFGIDKVHCEPWEKREDKPSLLCWEGKKKRLRTPSWWTYSSNCEVIDYGGDVLDDGGPGKGWRWLSRPHGRRTTHSIEVWADLFSWIDLETWVIVEGRGICFEQSGGRMERMD